MGRRGPLPTPTALMFLKGNPGRRPVTKREPQVPAGRPAPPEYFDAVALAEWQRITPLLAAAGLLTALDRAALAAYCSAYARWLDAEAKLRELGPLAPSARGGQQLSPYFRVANVALKQLREFGADFGLSPASRSRLQVEAAPPEGALERFIRRHRGAARSPVLPEAAPE
jgi:P27 family predicted phage terminase small subunit